MNIDHKNKLNLLSMAIGVALSIGQGAAQAHFKPTLELSGLNGSNGFVINGVSANDISGYSVSAAGDINGDGIDDLLIGAPYASPNGSKSGTSYVVFGSDQGLPNPLNLSTLETGSGIVIKGVAADDFSGVSVSAAGDINGDGIDDLLIGAPYASPNGSKSGASYVVFGSDQGLDSPLNLSTLTGSNGFVINGGKEDDNAGDSVSAAGDINGDGIDDLVIGARGVDVDSNKNNSGASYVVFGSENDFASSLELSGLDGSNGFVINGAAPGESSGRSVSNAGDINGDGFDDLVIGAPYAAPAASLSGASYVVFGSEEGFASSLELSGLNGSNGFVINGAIAGGLSGRSVSAVGDVNGDDIDDLIIGAPGTFVFPGEPGINGRGYVVFGSKEAFDSSLTLSGLNGSNGFAINGVKAGDGAGISVSAAGDINGDEVDDLIIGAEGADPNGDNSGAGYVVYGSKEGFTSLLELSRLNGSNGFTMNGVKTGNGTGISVNATGDINGDGADDLIIGADRADPNGDDSGASYVVFGIDEIFADSFE